jgi:hypothetical protein
MKAKIRTSKKPNLLLSERLNAAKQEILKTYITGALTIVPVSKKELFRKLRDKIELTDINQKVRKVSWISNMAKQKKLKL